MADPRASRALAQIDFLTSVLGTFVVALLLIIAGFTVFGSGSLFGIGDTETCTSVRAGAVPYEVRGGEREGVVGLEPDARSTTDTVKICDTAPSPGVQIGGALGGLGQIGLFLGSLWLVRGLSRRARRDGLFSTGVAASVRTLAVVLVIAAPVTALLESLSRGIVLDAAVRGVSWTDGLLDWDFSWTLLITGVGLLSLARVMGFAHELQHDVDGTV